ncbi:MAG: hypothetical protein CSA32_00435 [Desulfobulbus propionicus]|nr:MAG: hypothetical protein CSA32_00435 [Desulfobulbus propionicus]
METTIPVTGWKGAILVVGIVVLAFWMHDRIYYHNPKLDETIAALQSDDPATIAQALLETDTLGMARGHKLIPYILLLLGDERRVPDEIARKIVQRLQSSPGAISGVGKYLKDIQTIGLRAATTIQALVIIDLHYRVSGIGGKARKRIISYVTERIDPDDEYTLSNGLIAVSQIRSKKLLPFWFQCLAIESEPVRIHALSGLSYYIYDRTHGLFTWRPEKEISSSMAENLKRCLNDPSLYVRQNAEDIVRQLREAGFAL